MLAGQGVEVYFKPVMESFALVLVCIGLGYAVRRGTNLPHDSYKAINAWVLYIAIPALSLRYISAIDWSAEMILPLVCPLITWCGAWLYVSVYARRKKLDSQTRVALLVACGMGNTAFLGFPLVTAFYGAEWLSIAAICDFGTFIVFCTLAVTVVLNSAGGGQKVKISVLVKRMFTFPAFIAAVLAVILPRFIDLSPLYPFFDLFVVTVSPLSLFSIGMQLQFRDCGESLGHVATGLFYKLLISPIIVLALALAIGAKGQVAQVSVIEAAMAPHITASLLASQFDQNPRLCGLMVGIGILCALATTPLWWRLLEIIL